MDTTKSYDLKLVQDQFLNDYATFRAATSQNFTYNKNKYPAVYMDGDQYAYLNISSNKSQLTLIV
jgi:hypothetical protein